YCFCDEWSEEEGCPSDWNVYEGPFTIPEESCHVIEYYSIDNLENVEEVKYQQVYVDNTAPETTKVIGEPKIPCSEEEECNYHISQSTEITLSCVDVGEHQSDSVRICYRYSVDEEPIGEWNCLETNEVTITFEEDSTHYFEYYCVDILGNEEEVHEQIYKVDGTAPTISIEYGEPNYDAGFFYYITSNTPITIEAEDQGDCAIGVEEIYFKYCWENETIDGECPGEWIVYEGPFTIPEESAHQIDVKAIDRLGNEAITSTTVEVDNTPPEIGTCFGENTYHNPEYPTPCDTVSIGAKPTDEKSGVEWGEGVATLHYSINGGEWRVADMYNPSTPLCPFWYFIPESLSIGDHVQYYIEISDHLGNVNTTPIYDFYVGTHYKIDLYPGWNLISFPVTPLDPDIEEVLEDVDFTVVWAYDPLNENAVDGWLVYTGDPETSNLEEVESGYGYWIMAGEEDSIIGVGTLMMPGNNVPPSRKLVPGWNLIGVYGEDCGDYMDGDEIPLACALYPLINTNTQLPRWTSVYGWDVEEGIFYGLDQCASGELKEGYWILMSPELEQYIYGPSVNCAWWEAFCRGYYP
ncbi:hypothetical protein DRN63_00655, partial [Nanoarchaeota archaeon]